MYGNSPLLNRKVNVKTQKLKEQIPRRRGPLLHLWSHDSPCYSYGPKIQGKVHQLNNKRIKTVTVQMYIFFLEILTIHDECKNGKQKWPLIKTAMNNQHTKPPTLIQHNLHEP
jgi:hypothetical protein